MKRLLIYNATGPHPQLISKWDLYVNHSFKRSHQNSQFFPICFKVPAHQYYRVRFINWRSKGNNQFPKPQLFKPFHRNIRQDTYLVNLDVKVRAGWERLKAERRRSLYSLELVSL